MTTEHTAIIHETLQRAAARHGWLTRDLSIQAHADGRDALMLPDELAQGPLGQGLTDIAAAAEDQPVDRALLAETIRHVMETLFVPLWGDNFAIPEGFHRTPLGQMINAAQGRVYDAGDILTGRAAATALGVAPQTISRLMTDGVLPYCIVANDRRPLRKGVEAECKRRANNNDI